MGVALQPVGVRRVAPGRPRRASALDERVDTPEDQVDEVQELLTRAFNGAVETLSRRRAVLDSMAEALLAQGSLEREEFLALLGDAA